MTLLTWLCGALQKGLIVAEQNRNSSFMFIYFKQ
jgi:hypothetical protein